MGWNHQRPSPLARAIWKEAGPIQFVWPWGFQKLLDGARALNLRTGGLTAKWRFNVAQKYDVDVAIEGNIPDRENPFTTPEYYHFDLPATLISGDGNQRVSMNNP